MGEVLPMFANIPEEETAVALSEVVTRYEDLKLVSYVDNKPDDDEIYPPMDSSLTVINSVYIANEQDEEDIRRAFAMIPFEGQDLDTLAESFLSGYRDLIVPNHNIAEDYLRTGFSTRELADIAYKVIEASKKAKIHTLAAYTLFSANDGSGEHYPALMITKELFSTLPMENRQAILGTLNLFNNNGVDLLDALEDDARSFIGSMLRNEPEVAGVIAVFAASLLLPRIEQMERLVELSLQNRGNRMRHTGDDDKQISRYGPIPQDPSLN